MAGEHILDLPKSVWILKIVQTVLAVICLGLAAYQLSVVSWSGGGLLLWTSLYTIIASVYYFVAIHSLPAIYNWIALLVLESFAVLWWLISWALQAAVLAGALIFDSYYGYDYGYGWYYKSKRDMVKRATYSAFDGVVSASLAFALINWILYIVTLVFVALAVHRHRKADRPIAMSNLSSSGHGTGKAEGEEVQQTV